MHSVPKFLSEDELEKQCFLSIINEIKDRQINMFELGAGGGTWCLSLAGIIDFDLLPNTKNKSYRCLAIEAEPTHYSWMVEHFKRQNINAIAIHGAVQDTCNDVYFDISSDPADHYGQQVVSKGEYRVKGFTIDYLIEKNKFPKVNIIQMDVQGSELKVFLGAKNSIEKGLIDYWMIGTHSWELEEKIIKEAKKNYDVILYLPTRSGVITHNIYGKVFLPSDGLLILQKREIQK